jgi:ATP phosphoribosyltransferase
MIRLALPNKGRLSEDARELLERAGLAFDVRGDRALQASLGDDFLALFARSRDIPEFLADGAADIGITGLDLIEECGRPLDELLDLGFAKCRLAIAGREDCDAASADDIPAGARVATSFPNIARRFFAERDKPVMIVPVSGAAENAPHLGVADFIVDLVSTGSTLRMNGLAEIETILTSTARLVARKELMVDGDVRRRVTELVAAIESVLRAQDKRYLMANVPRDALDRVKQILPGISGPTIVEVMDGGRFVAAHAVVDQRDIYRVIAELRAIGGEGILVTRIERLMP